MFFGVLVKLVGVLTLHGIVVLLYFASGLACIRSTKAQAQQMCVGGSLYVHMSRWNVSFVPQAYLDETAVVYLLRLSCAKQEENGHGGVCWLLRPCAPLRTLVCCQVILSWLHDSSTPPSSPLTRQLSSYTKNTVLPQKTLLARKLESAPSGLSQNTWHTQDYSKDIEGESPPGRGPRASSLVCRALDVVGGRSSTVRDGNEMRWTPSKHQRGHLFCLRVITRVRLAANVCCA